VDSVKELDVVEDFALVGAGTLADGARWELYRLQVNGVNALYLVAARVDAGPGVDVVTSLLTTMRDLVAAHLSVAAGITVDGAPTPIAEIGISPLLPLAVEAIEEAGWGPGRIAVPEPNP
jgi:hypothetical protein